MLNDERFALANGAMIIGLAVGVFYIIGWMIDVFSSLDLYTYQAKIAGGACVVVPILTLYARDYLMYHITNMWRDMFRDADNDYRNGRWR